MEIAEHIDALDTEGRALAAAAEQAGLDAVVPTCPGWRVRDLVGHVGVVHRWATDTVRDALPAPPAETEPPQDLLLDWYADGHAALVATLRAAPPDLICWSFLRAPSPLAFWARRQAHETAIHRVDAQSAAGGPVPDFTASFATDGVDELLNGFIARRRGRLVADPERSLLVVPTDAPAAFPIPAWHLTIGPEARDVHAAGHGDAADCTVSGPASALYLLLWNRRSAAELSAELIISGDPDVLALWRERAIISWT